MAIRRSKNPQPNSESFFSSLAPGLIDRALWDLHDDITFWVKDAEGCFVWVNEALSAQAQAPRDSIIGTCDSDWFFNELASVYMADDAGIIRGGPPIINKPELVMSADGCVEWCLTSKFPVRDRAGQVVGSCGMSRPMEAGGALPADYADLAAIVTFARTHVADGVTVEALAQAANMSLSTLERYVRRHLRITPKALLQRIRMNRARHLLTASALQVGEVALACGYESFSSFSRAFRQTYGCSPGSLRR